MKSNKSNSIIKIVLAGRANVGKSMLANAISKSNLKVGNYAGVTVEKATIKFKDHSHTLEIVDLPGLHFIDESSKDEQVSSTYLLNEDYDVIVNVVDSTNLQNNLLSTLALKNLNKKMVLVLNMADELENEGISIDVEQIENITGIPTALVSSKTKEGLDRLLKIIHVIADEPKRRESKIIYSDIVEDVISSVEKCINDGAFVDESLSAREIAIGLVLEDKKICANMYDRPIMGELQPILTKSQREIYAYHKRENAKEAQSLEHLEIAKSICQKTITYRDKTKKQNTTNKIDNVLLNNIFGIPIFLFLMWGLFQIVFEFGQAPMDLIDSFFAILGNSIGENISNETLRSILVDGIIAGVGAVVLFLPNIILLYIGIALLETTGYMSRVAFLLDGFFHRFGLHGKSFIPLVTGFGCSVPAYMAARTLQNEKDRLITLFIIGFMSCGARLPIYVLFVGAFFSKEHAGNVLFAIYISGALLGLVMAKILRMTAFRGEDELFVMEMPKYRLPSLSLIYMTVKNKAMSYIKKAGTVILVASVAIWFASTYPKYEHIEQKYEERISQESDKAVIKDLKNELLLEQLKNSYLGQIGQASEFLFTPIGLDWKMTIALETGLMAKEIVVSTLGVLYAIGDGVDENSKSLIENIRKNIPFASGVSLIIFVMIYLPCLAASMVFAKEAGGYRYLFYLFVFTTSLAWVFSFIGYRVALMV